MTFQPKTLLTVALLMLAGWCINAELRAYHAKLRLASVRMGSITFDATDAETGQLLPTRVRLPGPNAANSLPAMIVESTNDLRLIVRFAAAAPLELHVSADGYQEQTVTIQPDNRTSSMVVPLKRNNVP